MTKPTTLLLILALAAVNAFPQSNNPTPDKGTPATAPAARPDPIDDPGVRKLSRRERKDRIAALEEKYRVFLKDVEPIMLPTELNAFLALESNAQRDVYIEAFWKQRDSDPKTSYNEYRETYYERIVEAKEKFSYLTSDRSRTYLVKGKPDDVFKSDCTRYLQPIEVWHYFLLEGMGHHVYLLFYQPRLGSEYELWRSVGRTNEDLEKLLSPDGRQLGAQEVFYGSAAGRNGPRVSRIGFECMHGDEILKALFWMQSSKVDVVKLFDPPAVSGEGVKKILEAAVLFNPNAPKLSAEFSVRYPGKKGAMTSVEMTVILDRSQLSVKDIDGAKSYSVNVTGELLKDEKMFENFRYRFDFPAEATGEKIPVTIERFLRPADYKPRIKLVDLGSGAEALVESSITVPEIQDSAEQIARKEQSESALTLLQDEGRRGESRLRIAPLPDELLSGLQHIETIVTGEAVKAVEFYLDNRKVMVKRAPPYTLDLDFGSVPQMRKIKAVGLDASGSIVTGDEIVVNTGGDAFRVRIAHPRVMNKVSGKVRVEIDAHVPEGKTLERIELYLNELKLATLFDPPFVQTIDIPATAGVGYLRAVAALTDPEITPIEDVVFINTPQFLEQIEVHLIELPTTVLRGGRTVTGLERSAFRVLDEGKPVPISRFDYVTNLPLSIGMALDTSESMRPRILEAQKAAAQFFKNVLEGGDKGFLVSFSSQPQLVQKWTPKLSDLSAGVSSLRAEEATAIFDAIVFSLYNFQGVKGQKALVVLTDGKDTASRFSFDQSLEYARRAAVPIYVIGLGIKPTEIDARFKMGRFARETGGATYYIERAEGLAKIYNDIQVELRSQYLLGFYPPAGVKSGSKWREVIVEVKDGRAKTIRGYYP